MFLNLIFVVIVAIVAFAVPVLFNTLTSSDKTRPFFHQRDDDTLGSAPQKDLQEIELTIKDLPANKPDLVEKNTPRTFPAVTAQINPAPPLPLLLNSKPSKTLLTIVITNSNFHKHNCLHKTSVLLETTSKRRVI
ncbi:MAG: hypothetical protein EBQ84_10530 [Betaproteobacteria bacterium]|nr:hypothetical protein [Betaproteobacteria bacterium]